MAQTTRRRFLYQMGLASLGLSGISSATKHMPFMKSEKKLGVALVGLGSYATHQLGPALLETEHCYLSGIVTGTPSKIPIWQDKYGIKDANVYNYENYDEIIDNDEIDVVYVVLPNSMHAEYSIRALEAGKHVICEKPMAMSVAECDQMIAAARKAHKMLAIGYRLHFDPYNMEMMRLGQNEVYGPIEKMQGAFGIHVGDPTQWRLKMDMAGGGPLVDVGIYSIQAFCYTSGQEPKAVRAWELPKTMPEKFADVEQAMRWEFDMAGGALAEGQTSYADSWNYLRADARDGKFELTSAYHYGGLAGHSPAGPITYPRVNQQALQMDGIAQSIKANKPTRVPGEMGRRDMVIIEATYEAMHSGKEVKIKL